MARLRTRGEDLGYAEARFAGRGGLRQEHQDGGRRGGAALHASLVQEDRAALEEVPRPRRGRDVQGGRSRLHRGEPAHLEKQALGRAEGQEGLIGGAATPWARGGP